ncbi:zinc finger protein 614 [Procambarus clarkii]|uniref:zinc finger protein 614 n=1 Tax=Procambarus clarkii TaxID=6728 RepID=UPI00374236DD
MILDPKFTIIRDIMGSFVTLNLQSLVSLLETCHNCSTGNAAQVITGDTLSVRLGSEVGRPFTFLCCGTIISSGGAIFWHSEEITPDAITSSNEVIQQPLKVMDGNTEEKRGVEEFEDLIIKCEDDSGKKFESEEINLHNILVEEDPLLVDDLAIEKTNVDECCTSENNEKIIVVSPENTIARTNLVGILTHQDSLGSLESPCESKATGLTKRTKYPEVFTCEYCGKVFTGKERAYQFYYHRNREHTHEMVYRCDICSKEFWGDRELLSHMSGHRDQGHICHICGQKFNAKKNLKTHLLTHLSIREYICRYCDKSFRRKDHLTVHERIHTGVRPYQCKWCDSGYPQKHQLKLHIRKCPILKRQEAKPYTLKNH